jgi:succinate-acetate transporter protein
MAHAVDQPDGTQSVTPQMERQIERTVLRTIDRNLSGATADAPLADPGALAVTAFSTSSFMLGLYLSKTVGAESLPVLFPVAFFFGGFIQLVVSMFEVVRGNVFGAAVFGTFGTFWVVLAAINTWFASMIKPASAADTGVAVFLLMYAIVSVYFLIAALKTDVVLVMIFLLLVPSLALVSWGYAHGNPTGGAVQVGGWFVMVFAVLGWYHAAADVTAHTFGRQLLPVGPLTA